MVKSSKHTFVLILLIGLLYGFTGTGYLTWIYKISDMFPIKLIDAFGNIIDYFFQAVGILVTTFLLKSHFNKNRIIFYTAIVFEVVFMILAILTSSSYATFVFAIGMDFCFGILFASTFSMICGLPHNVHGIVVGIGWAIGSIASFLVSIPAEGRFLKSEYSLVLYILLAFVCAVLFKLFWDLEYKEFENNKPKYTNSDKINTFSINWVIQSVLLIVLLESIISLGFLFPVSEIVGGSISFELSRSFYSIGLIIAGLLFIKSRQNGIILCLCSLVCPFLSLLFENYTIADSIIWALNYILIGPIMVYATIIFTHHTEYGFFLAGLGLFARRVGQIISFTVGSRLREYPPVLIIITFVLLVLAFYATYLYEKKNRLSEKILIKNNLQNILDNKSEYENIIENDVVLNFEIDMSENKEETDTEIKQNLFCEKYTITAREKEVMLLALAGNSNPVIAQKLFISENTIKFHMKNILKKTGVQNRVELRIKYEEF
ncbi:MAG: LuxR family transcriptional regulator [Lachnospiraceae bacterium]|nr:LuxR family transcriptional regulator [Lachnospiraceae bacterium]